MPVRRVVTTEIDGRSTVLLDGDAPQSMFEEIWTTTAASPWGEEPDLASSFDDVQPGQTRFRMVTLPPDDVMRAALAAVEVEGIDPDGFHSSSTVDYVFVLDGDVELELDDKSVLLHPGDCVVQRGTRHAWRNRNAFNIRLLTVMVGAA